jgi:general secretion pathway protein N
VAEFLRPLTLLLGGAALWALCLLVLALGGLGSRFAPPGAVAAPPPLPKVTLAATASRLGPWENYAEGGSRPLLNVQRRAVAVALDASGAGATDELDVTLSSVLITARLKAAILTDNKDASTRRVRLGELVEGTNWRLVSLEPRRAVLEGPSGQRALDLRVFDGQGGEAPTPVAANGDEDAAAAPARVVPSPASSKPPPVAQAAPPPPPASQPEPNQMSQEEQVEAIRRRIEARRAQMRAEAEAAAAQNR